MPSKPFKLTSKIGNEYSCDSCNKSYNNRKAIDLHIKVAHKNNNIVNKNPTHRCEFCKREFTSKKYIKEHLKKCNISNLVQIKTYTFCI